MMNALRVNDTVQFSKKARESKEYKPLLASAMELAIRGVISLDEVMALEEGESSASYQPILL